ncbi:sulfotransferase [Epibacterium ulvae]|uniref:sulfotransferase n=1 Tax=Epibacterium ulvae TaxID=1156985 RepID=UPI002490871E|nr:sulfotransferase [Epibacterium ulvae]
MTLKVVNLGLPKSGTSTLARALREAGYRVADHRLRERERDEPGKRRVFVAELLYRGYYKSGDPMHYMQRYEAISEMNFMHGKKSIWAQCDFMMLRRLKQFYPNIKFIATRREPESHSRSIMNWNNLGTKRLGQYPVPGLPPGFGSTTDQQIRWISAHHDTLNHWFRDDADFLEVDVSDPDAQSKIGKFLGRDLPWWGRENANPNPSES